MASRLSDEEVRQAIDEWTAAVRSAPDSRLLRALEEICPGLTKAFVVHWIPEQGEDIYQVVAMNQERAVMAHIEVSKVDATQKAQVTHVSPLSRDHLRGVKGHSHERRFIEAFLERADQSR